MTALKRDMTTRELLLKAAELIERGWTQGVGARSAHGRPVKATSTRAICWCAEGAIAAASSGVHTYDARRALLRALPPRAPSIMAWNDAPGRTQEEVAAAIRAAAETCP